MTDDLDPVIELLLRPHMEVTLNVDAGAARMLPDDVLERVLGEAARKMVRELLEEHDDA